ncbi:MAG: protein kinase [Myxococcota bacterium]|nr:protein kinase [Myxococcota bacterium]
MTECTRCRRQYADGVRFCPVDGFAAVPISDPYVGRLLLGQFQIVAACGRGATGTVYRALQTGMDRQVAVKILRADLLQDPTVVKRFIREARAGARLCHPNIATVHLVGQTEEGVPYIVMEYVEGEPLSALLSEQGPLPPGRLLHLGEQIASALAEAHEKNIIHRDLKPENILLTERRGDRDVVKIVDFGIAKIVADYHHGDSQLSRIGTVFGTPHYIAPEQASGTDIDPRADLYSLGCILFQMATGRVPFEGTSGIQVLLRHLREEPPHPRALNPALSEPLAQLILDLLRKDPAERPANGEQVLLRIRQLRQGSGSLSLAPSEPMLPQGGGLPSAEQTPAASAAAPGASSANEPEEAEVAALLPWWRRRAGLLLGTAVALGGLVGAMLVHRVHSRGQAATGGPPPARSAQVAEQPPQAEPARPALRAQPERLPPQASDAVRPELRRRRSQQRDEELPEIHFPAGGPPRIVRPLPAGPQAEPPPIRTEASSPPGEPSPPSLPPPVFSAPAAGPPPSSAPTGPGTPPAATAPSTPPAATAPATEPPSPPASPPAAGPHPPPPPEEDDPSQDPYRMLR